MKCVGRGALTQMAHVFQKPEVLEARRATAVSVVSGNPWFSQQEQFFVPLNWSLHSLLMTVYMQSEMLVLCGS